MRILVTGGAGYIGSHTCVELLKAGDTVTVVDNLSNSQPEALNRIARICGVRPGFINCDIRDRECLHRAFVEHQPEAVVHFAGLKAVGESVAQPLRYYDNNVQGTLALLDVMQQHDVRTLVFSSSATVYGDPASVPIAEDFPRSATNPYGRSKLMIEYMLEDLVVAQDGWHIAMLRYFNPAGAHDSGLIGEDPRGIPNNLMPYMTQVAAGQLDKLSVFGDDYPTPDGTGVRDYIHVVDLARGHLSALAYLRKRPGIHTFNLGTGRGYSVLEMVAAFERVTGRPVPYEITGRRPGDVAACYADPRAAEAAMGWRAERDIDVMVADAWHWQSANPNGYRPADDISSDKS